MIDQNVAEEQQVPSEVVPPVVEQEVAVEMKKEEDSFDIEKELNRREARAAKFNTPFDREAARQKILAEHMLSNVTS